jgi:hypothetical protein
MLMLNRVERACSLERVSVRFAARSTAVKLTR